MLPEDPNWFSNSGNHVISKEWTNALQLGMDTMIGDTSDMTYPPPAGTTMSWGGMKVLFWQYNTGVVAGADKTIDDVFDYRNRVIKIIEGGGYNAADRMAGEASWSGAGGMSYDYPLNTNTALYTEDGATGGDPPVGGANYLKLDAGDNFYIYADSANGGALTFLNKHSTDTIYPFLILLVSDQFPTRT
jgi:hypothetical protein